MTIDKLQPGGAPLPPRKPAAPTPAVPAAPAAPPPKPVPADGMALDAFADPFEADGDDGFAPLDDLATTHEDWRAPERPFFDFGHAPVAGTIWRIEPGQGVFWADAGTRVTPAQADRMPAIQRSAYYRALGQDPAPPRPESVRGPSGGV